MKPVSLRETIINSVHSHGLSGRPLSLAVSGGPDSMAMAHVLITNNSDLNSEIEILHFNHQIRGREAKSDSDFVKSFFKALDVPTFVSEGNVLALSKKNKMSLEAAARTARYEFFATHICESKRNSVLTLGHNFDDQAETILMHAIRGSGLNGLQGMTGVSTQTIQGLDLKIFRPMLSVNRESVLKYCEDYDIPWKADSTNFSTEYTRNSIRLELIPFLKKYNPEISKSLVKLGNLAKRDHDYIQSKIEAIWPSIATTSNGGIVLNISRLQQLDASLTWRILRKAATDVKGDDHNTTYNHIELMLDITKGISGRSVNLPGKVIVTKSYDNLLVFKSDSDFLPAPVSNQPTLIATPGTTASERWKILASLKPSNFSYERNDLKKKISTFLNKDLMKGSLWVRSRNPGDTFQPSGMKNTKKLQDFMVDSKIPRIDRDSIPLIVSNKGIAAVVGWRVADWAIPSKGEHSLYIEFDPEKY